MIEHVTLVEQEFGDAMLFWISDGESKWISGATENLRALVERCELPSLKHYRVSGGDIHSTPATPKYRFCVGELLDYARKEVA